MLTIENHGPLIVATNYWTTEHERAGKILCSTNTNAGAVRLLLPRSQFGLVGEWRASEFVILSRGPWPEQRAADAVELLFEDRTETPFSIHLTADAFDVLPAEPEAGREWVFSAWALKKDKPKKAIERPCKWRRSKRLPDLSPWVD